MCVETSGEPRCLQCNYNLRGLDAAGDCPECGYAIERSLRGELLHNADCDWLGQLYFGALLVGSLPVCLTISLIFSRAEVPILWIGLITYTTGCWLTAIIEPKVREPASEMFLRVALRVLSGIAFVSTLLVMLGMVGESNTTGDFLAAAALAGALCLPCLLTRYARLARRMPKAAFAKHLNLIAKLWCIVIAALTMLLIATAIGYMGPGIGIASMLLTCATTVLVMWTFGMTWLMAGKLRAAYRRCGGIDSA